MRKLSTGADSTLGEYLKLTNVFFGPTSKATELIANKIKESPNGESEEVIADEGQMLFLLTQMDLENAE